MVTYLLIVMLIDIKLNAVAPIKRTAQKIREKINLNMFLEL